MKLYQALLLLGGALSGSCGGSKASEQPLKPASRTMSGVDWASEQVTAARCERELYCNNIGPEKEYPSSEQCRRSLLSEAYAELDACYDGVHRTRVNSCVDEIRAKPCGEFRLQSYAHCQLADLCVD